MNEQIEQIIRELLELDPSLQGQEASMKKIIEKLMGERPETGFDETFKSELKEKLLAEFSRKKPQRNRSFRIYWGMAAMFLIGVLALSLWFSEEQEMQPHSSVTPTDTHRAQNVDPVVNDRESVQKEPDVTTPEPKEQIVTGAVSDGGDKKKEGQSLSEDVSLKRDHIAPIPSAPKSMEQELAYNSAPRAVSPQLSKQKDEDKGRVLGGVMEARGGRRQEEKSKRHSRPVLESPSISDHNTEGYATVMENDFLPALSNPLSTFSIDVDTASYANTRRFLMQNRLPPVDAVRIEELINYFDYQYPIPQGEIPFAIHREMCRAPWNPNHKLVMVALQGKDLVHEELPPSNLVFLLDVSGSMNQANKLPLLKESFKILIQNLDKRDRVAIVVYAGAAGLVLPSSSASDKNTIISALDRLQAGGSTAGGEGIVLAYQTAAEHFIKGGNNRVILATDGDFNVGASSDAEMERLIEKYRRDGVYLSVLGFGTGNYKDSKMELLADRGNGNYAYIDSLIEARKVLTHDLRKTLFTIAKDVKIQVEFNPTKVSSYRLIGYENRLMKKEDFRDDRKDAGEIGAGHSVTVFYEIIPAETGKKGTKEELKYQDLLIRDSAVTSKEIMTIRVRYKLPDEDRGRETSEVLVDGDGDIEDMSPSMRFASAVAEFGMLLRNSQYKGSSSFERLVERARNSMGNDPFGYRTEFTRLAEIASILSQNRR